MPYHYTTPSTTTQTPTGGQGQTAPAGYHYMPDGSLMSDAEHAAMFSEKTITGFNLDTSDIKASGEKRKLTILGDKGAMFSLEIRNEDDKYYNFKTNVFQTSEAKLERVEIGNTNFTVDVTFPLVADADQYDFYLFSETNHNTKHAEYNEVRFPDGSIDINSTTGSNSNLIQKVVYQTLDVTLTIGGYSPNSLVTGTFGTKAITTSRNANITTTPFSFTVTTGTSNTLTINKQPVNNDVMAFITATPAATPIPIEGEDMYPAVTETDVVDGDFSAGTTHKIVMDTNVSSKMAVGDRITIATTALTDTVDGTITNSARVVMDNNVVTKMAVGDRITIVTDETEVKGQKFLDTNIVTVTALDPDGDNAKEFSMKDKDGNNANVGILDNTTLSFSNQRNYRWSLDNIHGLAPGMKQLKSTFFTARPIIKEYLTQTTIDEGGPNEYKVDNVRVPALDTLGMLPVTTRNATTNVKTTAQKGNVVFSEQALLTFGSGSNARIFSYGTSEINRLTGYDVEFTDLAVTLTPTITTTTAANSNSKSVVIADRIGISDRISTVSGIGINPTISGTDTVNGAISGASKIVMDTAVASTMQPGDVVTGDGIPTTSTITVVALNPDGDNVSEFSVSENVTVADGVTLSFSNQVNPNPFVVSGAGSVTGAGTIVLSATQTLESGVTLTFPGASTVATITGNIKVNKVGNEDVVLRFDLERFLTMR